MAIQYVESLVDYFRVRVRDKELFSYLLISLVVYLSVLMVLHLPHTVSLVLRSLQLAVARSKKIALIVAFNQMESYTVEQYCAICCSSATSRCPNCGAVAYCSEKCRRDHWKQCHKKECHLMVELKGCNMNHLAVYCKEQSKPCKDAGKITTCKEPEFSTSASEQERSATAKTMEIPQFIATKSTNKESEVRHVTLKSETVRASKQETLATTNKAVKIPQFLASKSNEECVVVNSNSMSKDRRSSKCNVVIYCSEHGWINNVHSQNPQPADGSEENKVEADHGIIPFKYTSVKWSSSLRSTDSSCMDSSDSDAISSLHDL